MKKRKAYDLDSFFNSIVALEFAEQDQIKNDLPELKEVIGHYRNVLGQFSPRSPKYKNQKENYQRYIEFDPSYYEVVWDISKAEKQIKELKIPAKRVSVASLIKQVDQSNISRDYLPLAGKNANPIIIVDYIPVKQKFAIDGNHRLVSRFRNDPHDLIWAYTLTSDQHQEVMWDNLSRVLYRIHENITSYCNFILGHITREQLDEKLLKIE